MIQIVQGHLLGNRYLQLVAILLVAVATLAAAFSYPGALAPFLINGCLAALLVRNALNNRSSFFSFFLIVFLILGCWAKLVLHFILDTQFIEPIGTFDNSAQSWDEALLATNVAFMTLLCCQWTTSRWHTASAKSPDYYGTLLKPALWLSLAFTALLLSFNFKFAILKVGTEPLIQLHSYIYVVVSFMIAWGNLILLATLGYWLVQAGKMKLETLFYILILEGAVTAVSMGSRAQMILHVAAPFAVYLIHARALVSSLRPLQWVRILCVTSALFVASLLLVSIDRVHSFAQAKPVETPPPAMKIVEEAPEPEPSLAYGSSPLETVVIDPSKSTKMLAAIIEPAPLELQFNSELPAATPEVTPQTATPAAAASALIPEPVTTPVETEAIKRARWKGMLTELSKLVVDRWVGIEGVLAVVSYPEKGWPLFVRSLSERPESGTQAIYQRMSNAQYAAYENFTFMTIPGPIAILLYSDSFAILAAGLVLLFVAGTLMERLAKQLVGNIFTQATIGVALAYLVVQTNFPRVQFFFLIEIFGFIAGLYVARLLLTRSGHKRAAAAQLA